MYVNLIFTPQCLQITSHFSNRLFCSVLKNHHVLKLHFDYVAGGGEWKKSLTSNHNLGLYVQSRFMNKNLYLIWRTLNSQYFMWRVKCKQYLTWCIEESSMLSSLSCSRHLWCLPHNLSHCHQWRTFCIILSKLSESKYQITFIEQNSNSYITYYIVN